MSADGQFIAGLVVCIPIGWLLVGWIQRFFRS